MQRTNNKYLLLAFSILALIVGGQAFVFAFAPNADANVIADKISHTELQVQQIFELEANPPNFSNDTLSLYIPRGITLYSERHNNVKLKSTNIYYQLHVFLSNIDTTVYAESRNPEAKSFSIKASNERFVKIYVTNIGGNYVELAVYNGAVEVISRVHITELEEALLMSTFLSNGVQVAANARTEDVIGKNEADSRRALQNDDDSQLNNDEQNDGNKDITLTL